ncbi:hypothetical protein DFP72DRAFT_906939 [Ephemerocybe angulata]|uniref:Uncharacterized protein n=1 Tax=Ephemerocybe angulata TaxID=980116 RepID=A0A8H6HR94_9AGAR|nr:hypothetical protein DFP72DRAFT_906939 [Tulosesus angulatus]
MGTTTQQSSRTTRSRKAPGAKSAVVPTVVPTPAQKVAARNKATGSVQVKGVELKRLNGEIVTSNFAFRSLPDDRKNQVVYFGFDSDSNAAIFILDCASSTVVKLLGEVGGKDEGCERMRYISSDGTQVARAFPDLEYTSAVLVYMGTERLLLSFGGRRVSPKEHANPVVSSFFLFDIDRRTWTEVLTEGGIPLPRVSGTGLWKDSRFYIFGGQVPGGQEELELARSYSVLAPVGKLVGGSWTITWVWIILDKPNPDGVPSLGFMSGFAFCNGGKDVILLPGSLTRPKNDLVYYRDYTPVIYNFDNDSFTILGSKGDFQKLPDEVVWYHAMPPPTKSLSAKLRPFKGLDLSGKPRTVSFLMRTGTDEPGEEGEKAMVSRLWAVSVAQDVQIQEINIHTHLNRLSIEHGVEFHGFATVKGTMYLIGESVVAGDDKDYVAKVLL